MKKAIALIIIFTVLLTGCSSKQNSTSQSNSLNSNTEDTSSNVTDTSEQSTPTVTPASESATSTPLPATPTNTATATPEPTSEPTVAPDAADDSLSVFADLPEYFYFSSGAGAWSTDLTINADGTFSGVYHDTNMGESGDGYSNGTIYYCNFSGKFTTPVKIDDYSYSMYIETLEMDGTPGDESIENDVKYIYSEAYGLTNANEIILYLPGFPVADLPEDFVMWSDLYTYEEQPETLPYYGLFNVQDGDGFVGYME